MELLLILNGNTIFVGEITTNNHDEINECPNTKTTQSKKHNNTASRFPDIEPMDT